MSSYRKNRADAPEGFFAAEAAGLAWLAAAAAVPVVAVHGYGPSHIDLERLHSASPQADAARELGRGLAALHNAGAPAFGWSPSPQAFFGPLNAPFPLNVNSHHRFADFWAEDRLRPLARKISPQLSPAQRDIITEAISLVRAGAFDGIAGSPAEQPSRVHGDLWSGNVMWHSSTDGTRATLIDPAAHGGHRLEDLALLSLFGAPHLEEIYAGYTEAHPLPAGWRDDLPAHLLFCLLAHVHIFGAGYADASADAADQTIAAARGH